MRPIGPGEQNVADQRQPRRGVEKDHMTGRMPGTVPDLEPKFADSHMITRRKPAVGREGGHRRYAENAALLFHALEPEPVANVRAVDRHLQELGDFGCATDVVDMPVCQHDLFEINAILARRPEYPVDVASRIDDSAQHRFRAPDDRTILLEGSDGNDDVTQVANASNGDLEPINGADATGVSARSHHSCGRYVRSERCSCAATF